MVPGNRWSMVDRYYPLADHRGARRTPPGGPNSFNFMQFLGKFGKIVRWRPPGEMASPPRGNPGSATGYLETLFIYIKLCQCMRAMTENLLHND